jgi:hypothetical protein
MSKSFGIIREGAKMEAAGKVKVPILAKGESLGG